MQLLPALTLLFHHKVREMITAPVIYWVFVVGFFSVMFATASWLLRREHDGKCLKQRNL